MSPGLPFLSTADGESDAPLIGQDQLSLNSTIRTATGFVDQWHIGRTSTTKSCPECSSRDVDSQSLASSKQANLLERTKHVSRQRKLAERNANESGLCQGGTQTLNLVRVPRLVSGRQRHNLTSDVQAQFEELFDKAREELEDDMTDLEPWLRLATWWLLKVSPFPKGTSC